jgi:hypothetical protein
MLAMMGGADADHLFSSNEKRPLALCQQYAFLEVDSNLEHHLHAHRITELLFKSS